MRHILDHSDAGRGEARAKAYLRLESRDGRHPAWRILHRQSRGEAGPGRLREYLKLERRAER